MNKKKNSSAFKVLFVSEMPNIVSLKLYFINIEVEEEKPEKKKKTCQVFSSGKEVVFGHGSIGFVLKVLDGLLDHGGSFLLGSC